MEVKKQAKEQTKAAGKNVALTTGGKLAAAAAVIVVATYSKYMGWMDEATYQETIKLTIGAVTVGLILGWSAKLKSALSN